MASGNILSVQHAEAILQWYLDNGVDEVMAADPVDRLAPKPVIVAAPASAAVTMPAVMPVSGTPETKAEAVRVAAAAETLEDLKAALQAFDGLGIKKTAMNLVFGSGNPRASVMVIGDAPEAEDDRAGVPFSGEMGQLTDKMFAAIGLDRKAEAAEQAIYLTNVLNWRPPGNRTPLVAEIEISLPFLHRHIALIRPKILYLMGGLASKALLGTDETVGKLRGKQHVFTCGDFSCPALVSYHPTFLLKSPLKKREAWDDLQALKELFSSQKE